MSPRAATTVLLTLAIWAPSMVMFLNGGLGPDAALMRLGLAFLAAAAGVRLVATVVEGYRVPRRRDPDHQATATTGR